MKKTMIVLAAFLCLQSTQTLAEGPIKNHFSALRAEVINLIGSPKLDDIKGEESVNINFTVNNNHELVVISTSNSKWDTYIKSKLNYKKVKTEEITMGEIYTLPVLFKQK